jgi:hypothetical protein
VPLADIHIAPYHGQMGTRSQKRKGESCIATKMKKSMHQGSKIHGYNGKVLAQETIEHEFDKSKETWVAISDDKKLRKI